MDRMSHRRQVALFVFGLKLGAGLVGYAAYCDHHRLTRELQEQQDLATRAASSQERCKVEASALAEVEAAGDRCLQLAAHECVVAGQDRRGREIASRLR